ncbi:F-box only protein 15-like [Littorina saxatilis]|uniref:F-box domain-containing protein n=1 Tax=Littorina saxatilis TaxID=31220 RepID=A0AAN9BZK7_9CAEN
MATRHKQQLGSYLSRHKNASVTPQTSADSKSGERKSKPRSSNRPSLSQRSATSSGGDRCRLPLIQRTTQLTGKTANLDGFLPDEILLKIFLYLDVVSLLQASQVSKRWCALARDDSLWKKIAQRYAGAEKPNNSKGATNPNTAEKSQSFLTQWRNVCIARCAKWRNQRALKMVKKTRLSPFTGLPRDTEKALKESGVTYQLSLVDTYGKECCTESSRVTYHKSSLGVTWHSFNFLPVIRVRRLRILAVCPLFYNEDGKAIKGSPYQRSLLWEGEMRLSEWTTEQHCLGEDDLVVLHKLPGDLLLATWKADGEMAFMAAGLHYDQLVQRCLLGTPTQCHTLQPREIIPDDIDNSYGLHDYSATIEFRSLRQSMWSQQFPGLHCRRHDLALGAAHFTLVHHDSTVDHTPLERSFSLPWRTELFKGNVQNAAWLDVTVLDERGEVFYASSSPVNADKPSVKGADLEYEEREHVLMKYEGDRASVHMQVGKLDYGKAFVRYLDLQVKASAINEWFGTKYLTP